MIYNSFNEVFATVANATQIRNNTNTDEGTDTVQGVDWFKFRGTVCSSLYANGNGWIGLGSNSESYSIKVNRRDQAMWDVWAEEGAIKKAENKFFRIRWNGYAHWNVTGEANQLTFDVLLLATGDIILNIVHWPSNYTNGTNQLMANPTVSFSPSSTSKQFTFIHQDSNGDAFELRNGIVDVFEVKRYLIGSGNDIYTVDNGVLAIVSGVTPNTLSAAIFQSNGFSDISDFGLAASLTNLKLYQWSDLTSHNVEANLVVVPKKQNVKAIVNFTPTYITGIRAFDVVYNGDVTVAYSYDDVTYTNEMSVADFIDLDKDALYNGLAANKVLYVKFSLNDTMANLTSFTTTFKRRGFS